MVKVLMVITIAVVAFLFAIIFREIDKAETETQEEQHVMTPAQPQDSVTDNRTVTAEAAQHAAPDAHAMQQPAPQAAPAPEATQSGGDKAVARIAPAAFGYMEQGARVQVVGVMSDLDKNGTLMRYIDTLCKERACEVDVGYQKDIIEAPWQKDIEALLKMFESGAVTDGALFVEADTVKIEGALKGGDNEAALKKIIAGLSAHGLKVQNRIAVSDTAAAAAVEEHNETSVTQAAQPAPKKAEQKAKTEQEVSQKAAAELPPKQPAAKESNITKPIVTKTPKAVEAPKAAKHAVHAAKAASPKPKAKKRKKPVRKHHVVKKAPKAPVKDIIAPSYMETTEDLPHSIGTKRTYHAQPVHQPSKGDDIVAEPKMEILH